MSMSRSGVARVLAGALMFASTFAAGPVLADSRPISVSLDRARIVKVPQGVQTLIIGNPLIADVTMLKGNTQMIVTGRSFGSTNLISLDAAGNAIDETMIKVTAGEQSLVVLRGTSQESYACNPRCNPTIALGDDGKFMNDSIANVKTRTGAALTGGK
jgi:hypothetical protein